MRIDEIPKLANFLRIFVIFSISLFLNLIIIKKLPKFWPFQKLSNFHNLIFFYLQIQNIQKIYYLKKALQIQKLSNLENYKKLERKFEKKTKFECSNN